MTSSYKSIEDLSERQLKKLKTNIQYSQTALNMMTISSAIASSTAITNTVSDTSRLKNIIVISGSALAILGGLSSLYFKKKMKKLKTKCGLDSQFKYSITDLNDELKKYSKKPTTSLNFNDVLTSKKGPQLPSYLDNTHTYTNPNSTKNQFKQPKNYTQSEIQDIEFTF